MDNTNRPAFPTDRMTHDLMSGLTKREYIAAMAMQGLLAASVPIVTPEQPNTLISTIAYDSVAYADELLKQLAVERTS